LIIPDFEIDDAQPKPLSSVSHQLKGENQILRTLDFVPHLRCTINPHFSPTIKVGLFCLTDDGLIKSKFLKIAKK